MPRGAEFLVVRLAERRGRARSLGEARPEIVRRLLPEKQQEVVRRWLEDRKRSANVEVSLP